MIFTLILSKRLGITLGGGVNNPKLTKNPPERVGHYFSIFSAISDSISN